MLTEDFKIVHKEKYNHDVLKIELVSPVVLPEMKAVSFVRVYGGAGETKEYAPSKADARSIVLAIKLCPDDKMACYLNGLKVDDSVKMSVFEPRARYKMNEHKNVLMICWGTGITPMFQILDHALNCSENETKFTLLFFNRAKKDVFLCDELKARKLISSALNVISVATESCECKESCRCGEKCKEKCAEECKENCAEECKEKCTEKCKEPCEHKERCTEKCKEPCECKDGASEKSACQALVEQKTSDILSGGKFDFHYVAGPSKFMKVVCGEPLSASNQGELSGVCKKAGLKADTVYKF